MTRPGRPAPVRARVTRTEWLTPRMTRVVLGGPGLADFDAGDHTDHYVKLRFPEPGAERPRTRTYTVRRWDGDNKELTLDVVVHGDEGIAGPWAANARPGDEIEIAGPGGGYAPDPAADWHLMAGDESALPAIAASVERLAAGARAYVFLEVGDQEDEQKLDSAADLEVRWLHRGDREVGSLIVPAVDALEFPPGDVQAFVHGEAGFVKELRRLLLVERGVSRNRMSISGYWRLGHDDEGWRAVKREWNQRMEAEQAAQ